MSDIQTIQEILDIYKKVLGQQINKENTTLFFGNSVPVEVKNSIKDLLSVLDIKEYEKYLKMPAVVGKNKTASLNFIKERVWEKLQGWKEKILTEAGKEVLLKAIVQAISTFAMSYFKLSDDLHN